MFATQPWTIAHDTCNIGLESQDIERLVSLGFAGEGATQGSSGITRADSAAGTNELVVASSNAHKITEIQTIFGDARGLSCVSLKEAHDRANLAFDEPEEDGASFLMNALIKAVDAHNKLGLPVIADDSGLMVDALGGEPGIYSARYAGGKDDDANNKKLLAELERAGALDVTERRARFVSVIVFIDQNERCTWSYGTCEGIVGFEYRGDFGFGYDPIFLPDETPGKTMAELVPEEKNEISHRKKALEQLVNLLQG